MKDRRTLLGIDIALVHRHRSNARRMRKQRVQHLTHSRNYSCRKFGALEYFSPQNKQTKIWKYKIDLACGKPQHYTDALLAMPNAALCGALVLLNKNAVPPERYGVEAVLLLQDRYPIDATPRAVAWFRKSLAIGLSSLALPRLLLRNDTARTKVNCQRTHFIFLSPCVQHFTHARFTRATVNLSRWQHVDSVRNFGT